MRVHDLKIWPIYYQVMRVGKKPFEIRFNDRDFQINDILLLREFHPEMNNYTGRMVTVRVVDIWRDNDISGLKQGFVAMFVEPTKI